jgi:hypothetical protein
MKRLRHHRLRARLSLLAMVALLWTQFAMASHPACTLASMVMSGTHAGMALADGPPPEPEPCHPSPAPTAAVDLSAGCESHCSRSDLASDASRALSVPALGPLPTSPLVRVLAHVPLSPAGAASPGPLCSWHRPTAHPANLLLI